MTHSVVNTYRAGAWMAVLVALSAAGCASLGTLNHYSQAPIHAGCPACGAAAGAACGCRPDARIGGYKPTRWARAEHPAAAPKPNHSVAQAANAAAPRDAANESSLVFAKGDLEANSPGEVEPADWQPELPPELAPAPGEVLVGPLPVATAHGCSPCARCGRRGPLGDGNWLKRHHCGGNACCRPHFPRVAQLRRFFHDHLLGCGRAACGSCRNDCAPIPGAPPAGSPNYGLMIATRMPTGRVTMAPFHPVYPPPPYLLDRIAAALWSGPLMSRLHCLLPHHRAKLCGQACYGPPSCRNLPPALIAIPAPVAPPVEEPLPAPEKPAPQEEPAPAPPAQGEPAPEPPPGLELPMPQAESEAPPVPPTMPEPPSPAPPTPEPAQPAPEEIPDLFPQRGEPQHDHENVARRSAVDGWHPEHSEPKAPTLEPPASPERGPRLNPIRSADDFGAVEKPSSRKSTLCFAGVAPTGTVTPVGHEEPLMR